ncbi:MAG TPA: class I SAM-dependent methyltransferase [Rhabdochlamydiaceae bacterium]|nr:class I SAM-dependent methyltransferase [Rhabdochlamydiaceae bacterium]
MKKVSLIALVLSFLVSLVSYADSFPSPYDSVDLLSFNPQGWYRNGPSLEWLIRRSNVKVVIEVGSWLGLSTRHIAKTIPEDGKVYAVDHWLGSPNEDNSVFDIPNLYRQFLSNVIHENLTHKITPVKMSSIEAASFLKNIKPDLVYIDATHEFNNVLLDLILWFPFVKGHGVLCGDDYYWGHEYPNGGPVKRAVDTFARENNLIVRDDGWMWYLEEKK